MYVHMYICKNYRPLRTFIVVEYVSLEESELGPKFVINEWTMKDINVVLVKRERHR